MQRRGMKWKIEGKAYDAPTDSFGIANYAKMPFGAGHRHYELEIMEVSGWLCAIQTYLL